jgi:hypothetical protein
MTAPIGYRMVERFDPTSGEAWSKYVEWSKLSHLKEVVGLDTMLCRVVVSFDTEEDWRHASHPDFLDAVFDDLPYAGNRLPAGLDPTRLQVIALQREPADERVRDLGPQGFEFCGFDLVEEATCTSALNSCGGFDDVFSAQDLNERGLVSDLAAARDIRRRLRAAHPEEAHADCALWALWRRALA